MIIETIAQLVVYLLFNFLLFMILYQVVALMMHCFCDDAVVISKKRTLLFFVGTVVFYVVTMLGAPLVGFCIGIFSGYIEKSLDLSIELNLSLDDFLDIISVVMSVPLYIWVALMTAYRKGSGIKKTLLRMLGSICFFELLSKAASLPVELVRYAITETGDFGKHLMETKITGMIVMDVFRCVLLLLLAIVLYIFFYRKGILLKLRKIDVIALVVYYIILSVLVELFVVAERENIPIGGGNPFVRYVVIAAMLLLIVMIPVLLVRTRLSASYKELNAYQQNFLEAELNASRQYKAAQEDTRAFRHDVQNNLTAIAMLMQEGRIDEAERYLNDMRTEVNALSPKVVSGDDMVDSLISSKLAKMSENGIRFSMDGVIDGGLNWKPMDICTVFANLLDNAIEAASQTENGFIRLECKKTGHHRLIRASNSCKENVDCESLLSGESHITSKEDKSLHGYGIGNIRKTVEKYGGMMQISCAERVFTMELLLAK